ncbi:hypothetical protein ACN27B_30160 [Micromonospora sp. WMMD754]|uniref:hypothetical protein n=1 Tax=Micromonospora sp. WMMD754 TaxID=3404114 RepID=UPI003BF4EF08
MHRYYNPELTEGQKAALDRENMAVLAAAQAALGNISSDIRALFVDAGSETFCPPLRRGGWSSRSLPGRY